MWLSGPSIESRIVVWGSSLSYVSIQYARLMKPFKFETCHVSLVLSNSCSEELWELLFVKANNDFLSYIYAIWKVAYPRNSLKPVPKVILNCSVTRFLINRFLIEKKRVSCLFYSWRGLMNNSLELKILTTPVYMQEFLFSAWIWKTN